jgi:hypothetical protein
MDEIDDVLLRPLANAIASLPRRQQQTVIVELPSNVFRDLCHVSEERGLTLEESDMDGRRRVWVRYPVLKPQSNKDTSSIVNIQDANYESDQRDHNGGSNDIDCFYYIKEGVNSELFWDSTGNARRLSQMPVHGTGGLVRMPSLHN